jgi:murein DD-endopeptidase MepM/ murein hydrolase activator NlpD
VPRHDLYIHARPARRRSRARVALLGLVAAVALVLVVPATIGLLAHPPLIQPGTAGAAPAAAAGPPSAAPSEAPVAEAPRIVSTGAALANERDADVARPDRTGRPSLEGLTGYVWPLAHPRLTLPFGPTPWGSRLVGGQSFHDGVDLATFCGDRVHAAHDGVVIAAGRKYDRAMGWLGNLKPYLRRLDRNHLWMTLPIMVVTDDGNGYRSMYAHFGRITVKKGDTVKAGQLIGYEGMTGRASGCHLHYGLFSPEDLTAFRMRPDVVKRMKLPKYQIARVDPLAVLPPKPGINAPREPKAPKDSRAP